MRFLFTSSATRTAVNCLAALGVCLWAAPAVGRSATFVSPEFKRTYAYFIKISSGGGSFAIPTLNGLTGTITYKNDSAPEKAKLYTAWGTYGTPPPPSNGGAIVAYAVVHLTTPPAVFATGGEPKSSISYAKLIPSKTYSIDLFDCTANRELTLENIGSPSNNMLTFFSPLDGTNTYVDETLCLELVQNP